LCEHLLRKQTKELKRELEFFQKEQWEVKEKMMCEKFNKLMRKTKTVIHDTSALNSSIMKYKIVIHLFEKYIIKNEKQWLKNKNYLFSEFLQRVRALKSQL